MNTVDASKSRRTSLRGSVALFAVCALLIPGGVGCDWVGPRTYRVPTGAMLPTIKVGQTIVVMRLPGGATKVKRGDIIVFRAPGEPDKLWIKRAIALGEDTVELRDRQLYLNGQLVDEPYIKPRTGGTRGFGLDSDNYGPVHVPKEQIIVMGDNRDNSRDSRTFGPIPQESVVGWVLF